MSLDICGSIIHIQQRISSHSHIYFIFCNMHAESILTLQRCFGFMIQFFISFLISGVHIHNYHVHFSPCHLKYIKKYPFLVSHRKSFTATILAISWKLVMIHASETKPDAQELPGDIGQTENALQCFTGIIIVSQTLSSFE